MIQLNKLETSYPACSGYTSVLRNTDLTIREGEFVMIMSTSGAGKTSFLSILGLLG